MFLHSTAHRSEFIAEYSALIVPIEAAARMRARSRKFARKSQRGRHDVHEKKRRGELPRPGSSSEGQPSLAAFTLDRLSRSVFRALCVYAVDFRVSAR